MTLLEKVARASFACWRKRMDELGHHLDMGHEFEDMTEQETEFALLNAMREPTETMDNAGEQWCDQTSAMVVWQAMIDAALNEKA